MLRLLDTMTIPPGGWRYYIKETATTISSYSLRQLEHSVRLHMDANGIPVKEPLMYYIEDQLCRSIPPSLCRDYANNGRPFTNKLSISQAISGTLIKTTWAIKGAKRVEQKEADARAEVCARCGFNVKPEAGCSGCATNRMRDAVAKVVGNRDVKYKDQLGACVGCGCALAAAVWLPLDIQQKYLPKEINKNLPDHCWKKKHEDGPTIEHRPEETDERVGT